MEGGNAVANLTEEEKEVLRKAKAIKEKVEEQKRQEELERRREMQRRREMELRREYEEDVDQIPEDFGEPIKKKKNSAKTTTASKNSNRKSQSQASRNNNVQQTQKAGSSKNSKGSTAKKNTRKKRKKKRNKLVAIIITIAAILLVLFLAVFFLIRSFVTKTNYEPYTTEYVRAADVMTNRNVKNILLIGSDERSAGDTKRSDAIILLSINEKKKKIVMTSFLRDSYVQIPGYGQQRINHSYQMGGPALLIQTIEENFKIGIDSYIKVDFFSFIDIIDCLGGIEIDVDADELNYVNLYVNEINTILGAPVGEQFLTESGVQTLNGRQALGYSRIRYIGSDFQRTERQREVLTAIFQKAKHLNLSNMGELITEVVPDLTTNINDNKMTLMIMKAVLYLGYDIVQFRVPMDGTWSDFNANGQEVLSIDFDANINGLRQTIYE